MDPVLNPCVSLMYLLSKVEVLCHRFPRHERGLSAELRSDYWSIPLGGNVKQDCRTKDRCLGQRLPHHSEWIVQDDEIHLESVRRNLMSFSAHVGLPTVWDRMDGFGVFACIRKRWDCGQRMSGWHRFCEDKHSNMEIPSDHGHEQCLLVSYTDRSCDSDRDTLPPVRNVWFSIDECMLKWRTRIQLTWCRQRFGTWPFRFVVHGWTTQWRSIFFLWTRRRCCSIDD